MWTALVDLTYAALFALSTVFGGNMALAIVVLSVTVRLALLPLTLRIAYRSLETQRKLKEIEPQVAELRRRKRYDDIARLYKEHGLSVFDVKGVMGGLVQAPIFFAVLAAIRRGILTVKPGPILLTICAGVFGFSAALGPNVTAQQRPVMFAISAIITVVLLARLSAGMVLYSIGSGAVGVLQAVLVRRRLRTSAV